MSSHRTTLALYALTVFVGAALLFLLQLVFARLALPLLGGAPAVWNTAMVFYQALLLAGYGYAHLLSSRAPLKIQVLVHGGLLAVTIGALPFAIPAGWEPPGGESPVPWLLGLLAVAVGLPFFAVSATSPLLQKWFAASGHPAAADPYFLYAASNAGSLLGLLAYPLWIEPNSTLGWQCGAWAAGFGGLGLLSTGCGARVWRTDGRAAGAAGGAGSAPSARRRRRWVMLAAVPSSLMLSVTTYLTSDIAAVPLLWALPLALYLLTFILVFARRPWLPHAAARRALPLLLVPVAMLLATGATTPVPLLAGLHLAGFFVAALVCHGELAADRPAAAQLTGFYLWLSLGGVLGGAFNALLAPLVFDTVAEYPLMLVAAAWLGLPRDRDFRRSDLALPAALALVAGGLLALVPGEGAARTFAVNGLPVLGCFLMSAYGPRFALALGAVLLVSRLAPEQERRTLARVRGFFGIHRVVADESGRFHLLFHGKTVHGMQSLDPAGRRVPLGYYHPAGPLGDVFANLAGPVAAVGLGTGAVAAYGKTGQPFTFYEIDPLVVRLAADPRHFRYLADSPARIEVVTGDARLTLAKAPAARYQLILLDAYSSDSIPVHLLTREALRGYLSKLAPGGRLAFHISNRHLDLRPVVGELARVAGLVAFHREDDAGDGEAAEGNASSRWVVMARRAEDLGPLPRSRHWQPLAGDPAGRVWTDDHSSVWQVLDLDLW
jgi:hypothetical protein